MDCNHTHSCEDDRQALLGRIQHLETLLEQQTFWQSKIEALSSPDLLKMISHELRSPLTEIRGYAMLLQRHEEVLPADERRAYLGSIDEASERLNSAIGRLIDLIRTTVEHA